MAGFTRSARVGCWFSLPAGDGVVDLARNIEIKARLADFQSQYELAQALSGSAGELIHQLDIFFHCKQGRLKLRVFDDGHGELIHYQRPSDSGPKLSDYVISRSQDSETLREALARAYGIKAIVEKDRLLFMCGRTRVHLDRVKNLGSFLELEVVLEDHEDASVGYREAETLMADLGVDRESLVDCAYVDLISGAH